MARKKNAPAEGEEGKPSESKSERFTRLAKARMSVVLYRLSQVKQLGGPSYEYTADQAVKIVATLRAEVNAIEAALKPREKGENGKPEFDF